MLGGCLTATSSCHLEDLGGFGVGIEVGLRKEREIGSLRERERERERMFCIQHIITLGML